MQKLNLLLIISITCILSLGISSQAEAAPITAYNYIQSQNNGQIPVTFGSSYSTLDMNTISDNETQVQMATIHKGTITQVTFNVILNPLSQNVVLHFRANGVNIGSPCTFTPSSLGVVNCIVNGNFNANDKLDFQTVGNEIDGYPLTANYQIEIKYTF